jgi:hypothetical protein
MISSILASTSPVVRLEQKKEEMGKEEMKQEQRKRKLSSRHKDKHKKMSDIYNQQLSKTSPSKIIKLNYSPFIPPKTNHDRLSLQSRDIFE